jgi:hypothetical protein
MNFFSVSSEMFGVVFRDMKMKLEFRGYQKEMSVERGSGFRARLQEFNFLKVYVNNF